MENKKLLRWYDPFLLRTVPYAGALFIKLLLYTCKIVHIEGEDFSETALYATWHQRMSFFARYLAKKKLIILISQSRDGEYGAKLAKCLGFGYIRGSSTRGGIKAMREMITQLKKGKSVGILADGPLGPPRIAKTGPIIIARESGVPIVPILWGCDRGWIFNSWDRYLVPKPFSKIVIRYGKHIFVPQDIKAEGLEFYRKRLQDILNECTKWCDDFFGVTIPWQKEK